MLNCVLFDDLNDIILYSLSFVLIKVNENNETNFLLFTYGFNLLYMIRHPKIISYVYTYGVEIHF